MSKQANKTAIDWFNIQTGEKVYTTGSAQIKALIESSDLGVNKQSDRGWRLGAEWTKKLRAARQNRQLLSELGKLSGSEVTDTQLIVAVFEREAEADKQAEAVENDAPFEQEYLDSINPKSSK